MRPDQVAHRRPPSGFAVHACPRRRRAARSSMNPPASPLRRGEIATPRNAEVLLALSPPAARTSTGCVHRLATVAASGNRTRPRSCTRELRHPTSRLQVVSMTPPPSRAQSAAPRRRRTSRAPAAPLVRVLAPWRCIPRRSRPSPWTRARTPTRRDSSGPSTSTARRRSGSTSAARCRITRRWTTCGRGCCPGSASASPTSGSCPATSGCRTSTSTSPTCTATDRCGRRSTTTSTSSCTPGERTELLDVDEYVEAVAAGLLAPDAAERAPARRRRRCTPGSPSTGTTSTPGSRRAGWCWTGPG